MRRRAPGALVLHAWPRRNHESAVHVSPIAECDIRDVHPSLPTGGKLPPGLQSGYQNIEPLYLPRNVPSGLQHCPLPLPETDRLDIVETLPLGEVLYDPQQQPAAQEPLVADDVLPRPIYADTSVRFWATALANSAVGRIGRSRPSACASIISSKTFPANPLWPSAAQASPSC